MADDDEDDRLMAQRAFKLSRVAMRFVEDGQELMDYLRRRGEYGTPGLAPRPGLILLDLNMPRKDGRQALEEIKSDPSLRMIPVVIMTTSRTDEDIVRAYRLGANSYITKPVTFPALAEVVKIIGLYWTEIVELPDGRGPA